MRIRTLTLGLLGMLILSERSLGGTSTLSLNDKINIARTRCAPPTKDELTLFREDVRTDIMQTPKQMSEVYQAVYNSDRRLAHRIGLNTSTSSFISENKAINDRHLQWRFYTRNLAIGYNGNIEIYENIEDSPGNTVSSVKGYRFFTGFNISANKKGCFPFEDQAGEIQYFDISAWDLQADCSRVNCGDT